MYDLNEINRQHGHYSSPYQDIESGDLTTTGENDSTYQKGEIAPQMAANEPTWVVKEDKQLPDDWYAVYSGSEKLGLGDKSPIAFVKYEAHAKDLIKKYHSFGYYEKMSEI